MWAGAKLFSQGRTIRSSSEEMIMGNTVSAEQDRTGHARGCVLRVRREKGEGRREKGEGRQ